MASCMPASAMRFVVASIGSSAKPGLTTSGPAPPWVLLYVPPMALASAGTCTIITGGPDMPSLVARPLRLKVVVRVTPLPADVNVQVTVTVAAPANWHAGVTMVASIVTSLPPALRPARLTSPWAPQPARQTATNTAMNTPCSPSFTRSMAPPVVGWPRDARC
jgi:hypothetical protein